MKMPIVNLFPRNEQTKFATQYPRPKEDLQCIFENLFTASQAFIYTRIVFASMVGPHFHQLIHHLVCLERFAGVTINQVQIPGEEQEDDFCKGNADMQGCAISAEGFKEYLERAISPRKQAWDKVAGMWVVPPALTPEEVACIEDTAKSIYAELTAPTSSTASESRRRPFYPSNGG